MGKITWDEEDISPKKAQVYLAKNMADNRRHSTASVSAYADDMQSGRWVTTHEAIAFDEKDRLIDGQQRLQSIISSGTTQRIWVARNVPSEAFRAINDGKPRSGSDVARWCGYNARPTLRAAITRRMILGTRRIRITNSRYPSAFKKFEEGTNFAMEQFPKPIKKISQAAVLAAVAKAYYTVGKHRLMAFCRVLRDGRYEDDEVPAHLLRDWLMNLDRGGGGSTMDQIYLNTQTCIQEFMKRNKAMKKIHTPAGEVFRFPWEKSEVA